MDRIIRDMRTLSERKQKKKEKDERKKKNQKEHIIKDNIVTDIRILLEQEK